MDSFILSVRRQTARPSLDPAHTCNTPCALSSQIGDNGPVSILPTNPARGLREPFLAGSHLFGAVIGTLLIANLSITTALETSRLLIVLLYGSTFVALFTASFLLHGLHHANGARAELFEKLDYAAIYLFIAGTYTPLCVFVLDNNLGGWLLAGQWLAALIGIASVFYWGFGKRHLQTAIFIFMGWSFLAALPSIARQLSADGIVYLFTGSLAYTVGAAIFAVAPPRVWNNLVCTHAVWHILVLVGAVSHFWMVETMLVAQG
jgi:hemolysin III